MVYLAMEWRFWPLESDCCVAHIILLGRHVCGPRVERKDIFGDQPGRWIRVVLQMILFHATILTSSWKAMNFIWPFRISCEISCVGYQVGGLADVLCLVTNHF